MGVHGLTRYCYQHEDSTSTRCDDLQDVTLAVDFVGFLYHLCDQLYREAQAEAHISSPTWLLLGGCPLRLERWMEDWLRKLRARKIRLVFVTDPPQCFGGAEHRKGYCLQDRALQKSDHIEQLSQSLQGTLFEPETSTDSSSSSGSLPLTDHGNESAVSTSVRPVSPAQRGKTAKTLQQTNGRFPFAREKLRGVLKKHGIPIKTASREADEELGNLVRVAGAYAVLAEDSDFLCMRGVRYIPFTKLTFKGAVSNNTSTDIDTDSNAETEATESCKVHARVFSSELVAKSLGLSVTQLVDLALICGNDLTPLLDNEFNMAASLNFPIQRMQAGSSLAPRDAAQWILGHLPTLENPELPQIEAECPGFLRSLYEIYRFYGHSGAFLKKFPMQVEPALVKKKLNSYKKLLDRFDYPQMAIDVLEAKARGLSQKFDPLPKVLGLEGKALNDMLISVRQLSYLALNATVVEELGKENVEIRLKRKDFMKSFLSIPVNSRSAKAIDRMFRSLVFSLLYQDPAGAPKAIGFAGALGRTDKRGLAVKTIVYSLLVFWKCERAYLLKSSLLSDHLMEIFLLTSLACLEADSSKQTPEPREMLAFNEQLLNWETYACVAGYVETLKQLHQLRLVLGNKLAPTSGCSTLFSAEVFVRVCQTVIQNGGESKAKKSGKKKTGFSQKQVEAVLEKFTGEASKTSRFWEDFSRVRGAMNRLKALITLPPNAGRTTAKAKTAAVQGLENAMTKSTPTSDGSSSDQLDLRAQAEKFVPVSSEVMAPQMPPAQLIPPPQLLPQPLMISTPPMMTNQPPLPPAPFVPPLPPMESPSHLKASAPSFDPRAMGLMPSSVAKRLKSESALNQNAAQFTPESDPEESKEPASLSGLMETLPVFQHREEILENVANNQLTIIQGETGCGKSTSVPQFLHDAWARDRASSERPVNIYVTQPRRIAAIELANTVARMRKGNEFDEDGVVGKVIGYRIGQKQMTSSKTKITYVTTGYMVERIIHDPEALQSMTHLVLDEVHERSMDVDLLLLLLKLQLNDNPHLRLVIMSATMDAKILVKYLGKALSTRLVNRKPLFVGSKLFPVENVCLDDFGRWFPRLWQRCRKELSFLNDQFGMLAESRVRAKSEMAMKAISKVHEKQVVVIEEMVRQLIEGHRYENGSQCILIFLPGIGSINTLYESLSLLAQNAPADEIVKVLVLHSGIELEHQQKAFEVVGRRSTKIILSTNIAESSVTIPDVTHVINSAIEKQIEMPNAGSTHAEVLVDTWCSRASALQRSGRAGRVMAGTAFHLFTQSFQDVCMDDYTTPELLRKPLDRIILQLKGRLSEFGVPSELLKKALDAPDLSHIDGAYKLLSYFDAIDSPLEEDSRLTKFGSFVCHLPLSLELCRLLMTGAYMVQDNVGKDSAASSRGSWPLLLNVVVLVAVLAVPDLFVMPSFYHAQSAQTYLKEMKKNLKAKLKMDGGLWSEPLAIWRFYMKTMSEQSLHGKRHMGGVFQKVSISFRRYQTLNFLISDLCARLVALAKSGSGEFTELLDAKTITMLRKLDAYASSQRMDKELLKFARNTVSGKQQEERVLRFLVVQNYGDHLIGSTRSKPPKFADDDLDDMDRVDLKLDRREAPTFFALSNKEKAEMFNQLAESDEPMNELAALAYEKQTVSIYSYSTPKNQSTEDKDDLDCEVSKDVLPRMSFPVSLIYYIRGEKFPVNLGLYPDPEGHELAFRFRVSASNSSAITWQQQKDNVKATTGNRSLFSLPVRPVSVKQGALEPKLLAVYADRLFTGDETRMFCSNCTLLPPNSISYYPVMLLVSAPRGANIRLHMDTKAGEILTVKVDGQDAIFPTKMALRTEALATINAVRAALSNSLNATPGARRLCASDLIALSDDSNYITKKCKAKAKQCEWKRLGMNEPDHETLAEGETPARFPELYLV